MKANPSKLPADLRKLAHGRPGDEVLLPSGAKLYYYTGSNRHGKRRGYFVYGYTNHDALPYL